jgi:hypothetical protein
VAEVPAEATSRIDHLLQFSADEQRRIDTALMPIVIAGR